MKNLLLKVCLGLTLCSVAGAAETCLVSVKQSPGIGYQVTCSKAEDSSKADADPMMFNDAVKFAEKNGYTKQTENEKGALGLTLVKPDSDSAAPAPQHATTDAPTPEQKNLPRACGRSMGVQDTCGSL